jgi:hypothetical protein
MKLIILRLDSANKPSPMSEGVAKIQINSQPCKDINLATRHTQARRHHEWQPFTTWPKSRARSYLTLVPSSTHMLWRTHRRWLEHYPILQPWSEVRYRPTRRHIKLLSSGIPCPVCVCTFQMFVHSDPTDVGLNRHRQGLPTLSSEFMIQTTLNLPIQNSPFSLNCPTRSLIMPTIWPSC